MKTLKVFLTLLIFGLFLFPVALFAQDITGVVTVADVTVYFATLMGIATLNTLVIEFIKKITKLAGTWVQVVSWITAFALCYIGWLLKWGVFTNVILWYVPLIYGAAVGLVSNGIYDISVVQAILRWLGLEPKLPELPKSCPVS